MRVVLQVPEIITSSFFFFFLLAVCYYVDSSHSPTIRSEWPSCLPQLLAFLAANSKRSEIS